MRIDRRIAVQTLLFCSLLSIAFGAGVTYPDGTVSPFPPAFIPAGIPRGEEISAVYGVAAKDGVILGAVGFGSDASGLNAESVLFLIGTGGINILEVEPGKAGDVAYGISGDGKIKVGSDGYWDEQNHFHKLPDAGYGAKVGSISRDGSTIGGDVATEDPTGQQLEATLWATGGTGLTRVGFLPGFQSSSFVNGVSADGQNVCGISIRGEDPSRSIPGLIQAFALRQGGAMQRLPGLAPDVDTYASDISNPFAPSVVGTSDGQPVAWTLQNDVFVAAALKSDYGGDAVAIDDNSFNIVGNTYTADGEYTAVLWEAGVPGTIKGRLANTYKRSIGMWDLLEADCISGDGYTVGGQGINPDGKYEGYVAVLPPILHPPLLVNPGPRHANVAEPFTLKIDVKNPDSAKAPTFTARGLPKGFGIDSSGFISGVWFADQAPAGIYTVTVTGKNSEGSGTTTFNLTLPAPPSDPANNKVIEGHGFLQLNKAPGETAFPASFGGGISANGLVATGHDGIGNDSRAYRWTATEGISGLPMLPGALRDYGTALATSGDGNTIVGQAAAAPADDGSNRSVATVWKTAPASTKALKIAPTTTYAVSEAASQLDAVNIGLFAGGIVSIANSVSADGSIVVGYGDATEKGISYQIFQAFRWTSSSGMVGLGWLPGGRKFSEAFGVSPDGSTIVGVSDSASGNQAFRWTQAEGMVGIGKLPGATFTRANAISANNSVIIGYGTVSGNNHAFRWTAAEGLVDLGLLSGDQFSEATAISADGSIIVGRSGIFPSSRPFIWDKANGMRDLKAVLVAGNPNLNDWTLKTADGISADGKIVTGSGKNPAGDSEGYSAALQVRAAQPLNISTRMRVLTGDKVLIGGFIITGTEAKKVIIRGIGPSLANTGLQGVMSDPTLELHQGNSTLGINDNWKEHQADVEATSIPPSNDLESAIVMTLSPGAYTAILADKLNRPGLGLVEVYDLAQSANSKLANISTRGFVDTGDNVMIGGFIVGGGSVGGFAKVIVRAIGPSLTASGVSGALSDTTLELYDGNGTAIATNDNWKLRSDGTSQQAEIEATTIPPKDDRESALVSTLAPGNYTAIVRGKGNSTGVGLVEAYNLL